MTTLRFQNLQPAPRKIAFTAKVLCSFSSVIPVGYAWVFAVGGLAVSALLFASFDRRDFMPIEWKATGQAKIVKKDNAKVNDFQKYVFEWQNPDGKMSRGECFSKYEYNVGSTVQVVCSAKDESLAKLEGGTFGTENRIWLPFIPLAIGIIIGGLPLFVTIRNGRKVIHLLQFGTPTFAQVQEYVQDGQTYVKHFPIIKFSVVFQASDKTVHSAELVEVRKDMKNIELELPVFYDPDNPGSSVKSFGMIPKGITYNSSKNIFRGGFFALFPHYLGIAALTITIIWIFVYFVSLLF